MCTFDHTVPFGDRRVSVYRVKGGLGLPGVASDAPPGRLLKGRCLRRPSPRAALGHILKSRLGYLNFVPGETWTTELSGVPLDSIRVRFVG
jgi:hypothetical protein